MSVWEQVPGLTTTEALCLLAMAHLEGVGGTARASVDYIEVQEVAATTGISTSTTGAALRSLRAKDLLVKVAYLDIDRRGRDIARPGYRLPEVTS